MRSAEQVEHFCTLFDAGFVLQGMALHTSLVRHARPFHLWIVCMDDVVRELLRSVNLPHVTLIDVGEIETNDLRSVKATRSTAEYCWTLTPFVCPAILERAPEAERVTYVDADVMFFDDPRILLAELDARGKDVLVTEHAYAEEYDQSATSGRFCVQFVTFTRSDAADRVARWWQERCIEWCYARFEDGKFGDQKYLDVWPMLFGDVVQISSMTDRTLAPWNVRHFAAKNNGTLMPVFYHFHGLRRFGRRHLRLYWGYQVGAAARRIYRECVLALRDAARRLDETGARVPHPPRLTLREWLWMTKPRLRARFARL